MTEPSKAAMERAEVLLNYAHWVDERDAVARYIDTVDRVAREAFQLITDADLDGGTLAVCLRDLMLCHEPDVKAVLREATRKVKQHPANLTANQMAQHIESHLKSAGYTITKDEK